MNCPVCDDKLREVEKHGVTVDICPGCKGVWLDRGELDKIIDLVQGASGTASPAPVAPRDERPYPEPPRDDRPYRDRDDDDRGEDRREYYRDDRRSHDSRRRRGGLLGEIFEMFGD